MLMNHMIQPKARMTMKATKKKRTIRCTWTVIDFRRPFIFRESIGV